MKGLNLVYKKADVAVVGAGIAGLTAAYLLHIKGYKVHVFESAGQIGGRMRTDRVGGFLLDRGFQLCFSAYPQLKNLIDTKRLDLEPIYPAALIRYNGEFNLLAMPGMRIRDMLSTMVADNATMKDKIKLLRLMAEANTLSDRKLLIQKDKTALEYFKEKGFSDKLIKSFFKPFLASTFLDDEMSTPSRLALFIFKMFNRGVVGLPKDGMAAVPEQLAGNLPDGSIHLNSRVKKVTQAGIQLAKGEFITADRVLIATNPLALPELLPDYAIDLDSRHVTCLYFATETAPVTKPVMIFNGEDKGLVNNLCVVDLIQPTYAPDGSHLVAIHVTKQHDYDDEELVDEVMKEMAQWFGIKVNSWEHLKTYHIKYALPKHDDIGCQQYAVSYNEQTVICGDHLSYGSVNAAMRSGKEAADLLHRSLKSAKKARPVPQE